MSKNRLIVFYIALTSILASLASVLKIFSIESPFYRLTVYEIPLIISGLIAGPVFGGIAGFITDVSYMIVKGYTPSLMTVSSILWGALPGIVYLFRNKIKGIVSLSIIIVIIIIITSFICFSINTLQLYLWYGEGYVITYLPTRIITALVKIPVQSIISIIIFTLFKKLTANSTYNTYLFEL